MSEARVRVLRRHPWAVGLVVGLALAVLWTALTALEHPGSLQAAALVGAITGVAGFIAMTGYTWRVIRSRGSPRPQPRWFFAAVVLLPIFVASGAESVVIGGHSVLEAILIMVLAALVTAAVLALGAAAVSLFRRLARRRAEG